RLIQSSVAATAVASVVLVGGCAPEPPGLPPVAPSLGQCALPPESIRFMIVVDRSGSMRPHWSAVRAQLARLVDRVPHGSLLHVEVFDGAAMDPAPVQLWWARQQSRVA